MNFFKLFNFENGIKLKLKLKEKTEKKIILI